jgi:hypothetical protein
VPLSATAPHEAESSAASSSLPQTEIVPDDRIESAVDHAAHDADALCSPTGVETGIVIIDTTAESVGPIQSAIAYAESLNGTLDCLAESAGYLNGVIELVKDFAEVDVFLLCSLHWYSVFALC